MSEPKAKTDVETDGTLERARSLLGMLRLCWRASGWMSTLIPLLTVVLGATPIAYLLISKQIVDTLVAATQSGNPRQWMRPLWLYVALAFATKIVHAVSREGCWLVEQLFQRRLVGYLRHEVITKAMTLDLASFESPQFYDRLKRADSEVCYRPFAVLGSLMSVGQAAVTLLSCLFVLATLNRWIVPAIFVIMLPPLLLQAHYGRTRWALLYHRSTDERKMHYLETLMTMADGFCELRIFGLHHYLLNNWRLLFERLYDEEKSATVRYALSLTMLSLSHVLFLTFFYVLMIRNAVTGLITVGSVVMFAQTMEQCLGTMSGIVQGIGILYESSLFLSNLFEYLGHQPRLREPATPVSLPLPLHGRLELRNVSFSYPETGRQVLSDLSLTIGAGERVAFVGENGAGKTTIAKLLARLYDPDAGTISVDGVDLRTVLSSDWQRRLAVVFQGYMRFNLTARENVGFGCVNQMDDDRRLKDAAESAGLARMISELPNYWETGLGCMFEGGVELSLGQWQRVALARAVFSAADILILDEPSASLDAKQEHELFQHFERITRRKTTVLISHRLSCMSRVDRIYVLDSGRIVEQGSHRELMANDGLYASMYRRQAQSYTP